MPPPQTAVEQSAALPMDESGQIHFMDGAVRWQGGEGTAEKIHCPRCAAKGKRSTLMFSRTKGQGTTLGLINKSGQQCNPAPICFACGYNGLYEPFGGDLNSITG